MTSTIQLETDRGDFYKKAFVLSFITILYNIIEGVVSVWFGISDETLSLLGFGIDSFVEVISGAGIMHMVLRMRVDGTEDTDRFERTALRITGTAFYMLTIGLLITAVHNLSTGSRPSTTFWGIIISLISILTMYLLIRFKLKTAKQYGSKALEADANCTRTCLYLSFLLLAASLGYELTGIGGMDSLGAIGIAWFSYKEGRESFSKAKGISCSCSCGCSR